MTVISSTRSSDWVISAFSAYQPVAAALPVGV